MPPAGSEPTNIRSIAVSVEDVVAAVETNRTSERTAVLRVTPPFSGRMRARLHIQTDEQAERAAVHVDPEQLLGPDAPAYPRPAETEDAIRADPDTEYTVETHRNRHKQAVETWRSDIPETIRDRVTLETRAGSVDVDVYVLG